MSFIRAFSRRACAAARSAHRTVVAFLGLFDLRDLHVYGGIALIAAGLDVVSLPLSAVVVGAILLWLGVRK